MKYLSIIAMILIACNTSKKNDSVSSKSQKTEIQLSDCEQFIELHSISYLAKEYMESESWVLNNVKINLWDGPNNQRSLKPVGKLLPGSRAIILDEQRGSYKVKSPLDQSVGWINNVQVSKTGYYNPITYEPCNK